MPVVSLPVTPPEQRKDSPVLYCLPFLLYLFSGVAGEVLARVWFRLGVCCPTELHAQLFFFLCGVGDEPRASCF